jgi:catechol 2,3-dioxygenase-like lactoylglutathione lyase family enzyme
MNALVELVLTNPRLHHVGIVVPSEAQASLQMKRLGLFEDYRGRVEVWNVLCIFARANGGSPIEFVVPGADGPLRSFNQGLGGLHHVALTVPDLAEAMRRFAAMGIEMVAPAPVKGAGPFLCNFLPPIYTRGYAVELIQELEPAAC